MNAAGNEPSGRRAPVLVLAVGNPSRGDDALGPLLAERLDAAAFPGVEVITEFQLQVENALDLEGRDLVIILDAGSGTPAPFELRRVEAAADFVHTTHALSPEALLAICERVVGGVSAETSVTRQRSTSVTRQRSTSVTRQRSTWLLCVRGESFELGEGLSAEAAANLEAAWRELRSRVAATSPGGPDERP